MNPGIVPRLMRHFDGFQHPNGMFGAHIPTLPAWRTLLPSHLAARTRLVGEHQTTPERGKYVLYWMRSAQRAHDNPALEVACQLALHLHTGVCIYQGLSSRYPYPSHRTHRFILEGAIDVREELRDTPLGHIVHVARSDDSSRPLLELARHAACVVAEDLPLPWFRDQTLALAHRIQKPALVVDTACLFPLAQVDKKPTRAFSFRQATQEGRLEWVKAGWPNDGSWQRVRAFSTDDMPAVDTFDPLPDASNLDEAILQCDVDHGIPPVRDTPGGTRAGYLRWEQFRANGLTTYHQRRNDPLDANGVSRLSAYLHFGQISPFRLAHETWLHGGPGAEKYLDELLIWRELAHAFCDHAWQSHASISDLYGWLPGWAREELEAHAQDSRARVYTWEEMARAQSDSDLWNAMQISLLRHGELHNNLRMTWAKAIPGWTRTPLQALHRLMDLNDRYALDGRDPSSIGGLFWALGLFDRPFSPPTAVLGRVRPRPLDAHTERLDVRAYQRQVRRNPHPMAKVLIIGSGIAGLTCARTLSEQGHQVEVWDKGRGVGGRSATRRLRDAGITFDLGAQYFTATDPLFQTFVGSWREQGWVAPWNARFGEPTPAGQTVAAAESPLLTRYVAVPGMRSLAQHLSSSLLVHQNRRVVRLERHASGWRVHRAEDETAPATTDFDTVVLTAPPEQALPLVEAHSAFLTQIARSVRSHGVYALGLSFAASLPIALDGGMLDDEVLSWIARDSSKPGRPESRTAPERWVLHSTATYADLRNAASDEQVIHEMQNAFFRVVGAAPTASLSPIDVTLQRWRLARAVQPLRSGPVWDESIGLGLCGDWLNDGSIEGAFLSGRKMAGRVMIHMQSRCL